MGNYAGLRQLAAALQTAIDTRDDMLIKHTMRQLCSKTIGDFQKFRIRDYIFKVSNKNGLTIEVRRVTDSEPYVAYVSDSGYITSSQNRNFNIDVPIQDVIDEVLMNKMELLLREAEKEHANIHTK